MSQLKLIQKTRILHTHMKINMEEISFIKNRDRDNDSDVIMKQTRAAVLIYLTTITIYGHSLKKLLFYWDDTLRII